MSTRNSKECSVTLENQDYSKDFQCYCLHNGEIIPIYLNGDSEEVHRAELKTNMIFWVVSAENQLTLNVIDYSNGSILPIISSGTAVSGIFFPGPDNEESETYLKVHYNPL